MKDLVDIIEIILTVALILALVFLFKGEPDLWDLAHRAAMAHFKGAP